MAKHVIIHGGAKVPAEKYLGHFDGKTEKRDPVHGLNGQKHVHAEAGDVIELDDKDAKAMDPEGTCFMPYEKHAAMVKAEAAKKAILDEAAKGEKKDEKKGGGK